MPLAAHTRLGPYVLESLIGAGGMGEVYRAHDARLNRTVAVKVLSPDVATPERLQRFEQEARAASALNHPNILTIHDVGREAGTAYFAMEWVDGQTLRDLLRAGPISLRRTLDIAHQIAEGLAKAHAAGIVHRDLKPDNVMVTGDRLVKIVDFGIAKLDEAASLAQAETVTRLGGTKPGMFMGTVGYVSPEQASGRPVDYRSDQFALGLLIYELVSRRRPFDRATTAQSLAATIDEEPPPIETLNPDVPPHLAAIVRRCLAKDPSERYDSTRDLARDLKSVLDSSSWTTVAVPAAGFPRPRMRAAAIAAIVVLAAVVASAWVWRSRQQSTAEESRPLIAVRPFRNLSSDSGQSYFAAGITEEIRGQLSQVSSLRLLSRNALDRYQDGDRTQIVRDLGVGRFVDGTVRVDGGRVRITAELSDASTQETLWSDRYDRQLADVLRVQSDVALQIARALHANLSPHEQHRLELRPTANHEAYGLYLQSQQMVPLSDRAQNLAGIELLRTVLKLDPGFAAAQARLAYRLVFMGYYDSVSYVDQGIAEAQAALRSDSALPGGYFALGSGYAIKGMDAQARQAFLRALELDPNHVGAMDNLSVHETAFGRLDDALYWARRAFGLSGKSGNNYYHVSVPLMTLRDDAVSRSWLTEGERRFPEFARLQFQLAGLELFEGRVEQARRRTATLSASLPQNEEIKFLRADMAYLTDGDDLEPALEALMANAAGNFVAVPESVRLRYGYVLRKRGDVARAAPLIAEAERLARDKIEHGNQLPPLRIELAAVAMLKGDTAGALEWLSRAVNAGFRDYIFLERDPIFVPLAADQRFRDALERIRRDVAAQRTKAAERGLLDLDALIAPAK